MYGYESWTIKKANSRRIDAFELWCWRRLLRIPWTARRLNQSILKEIIPEYPLEGFYWSWNSNILSPWCRVDSLEKTRILEIIESRRRRGGQRMRVLDGTPPLMSVDMSLNKLRETVKDREVWVAAVHGVAELDKSEWHNNWSFRYILLWTAFCIFVVFTFFLQSICLFFFSLLEFCTYKSFVWCMCCNHFSLFHVSHIFLVSFHDEIKFSIPMTLKLINISFFE